MRLDLQKGQYEARLANSPSDVLACQRLRHLCFFGTAGVDADTFDATWQHLMVSDQTGEVVCTLRFQVATGSAVLQGYAAGFYDLKSFAALDTPTLEIGRFCTSPTHPDPHILRVAWGAVTQIVDTAGCSLLFGCSSFPGVDPARHATAFHRLLHHHQAPAGFGPFHSGHAHVAFAALQETASPQSPMPPLLRTYLAMGGWVSDHAVVDKTMNTLHVLTALEVDQVPAARAKALRALA